MRSIIFIVLGSLLLAGFSYPMRADVKRFRAAEDCAGRICDPPRVFVLSIGVNDYAASELPDLRFAVADALSTSEEIAKGFPGPVTTQVLADGEFTRNG